jgi:hypothetical protein
MVLGDLIDSIRRYISGGSQPGHPQYGGPNVAPRKPGAPDNGLHHSTIDFPQGARFLDYRVDKNIRGIPYFQMSTDAGHGPSTQNYESRMEREKKELSGVANQGMIKNLDLIEAYTSSKTKNCVDRDAQYFRNVSKNMRDKQLAEKNVHYCLTGLDTNIAETNATNFSNLSYNQYSKAIGKNAMPWELSSMGVKTSPETLCDLNIINRSDKDLLNQPY